MYSQGTLLTSYINTILSFMGLMAIYNYFFDYHKYKERLRIIILFCFLSVICQFFIFTSKDGRPSMGYEINLTGSYLFLLYLVSDAMRLRWGKVIVIILSLLLLSRLLVFSIGILYIVRICKKPLKRYLFKNKPNIPILLLGIYVVFGLFCIWYTKNVTFEVAYDISINRFAHLNDGSNYIRFSVNAGVVSDIMTNIDTRSVLIGIGEATKNSDYREKNVFMPHNELLNSILEYGLIAVVLFAIFSVSVIKRQITFNNIEYFFSLLFYTLILWVHFIIVPSMEMIFIVFLLNIKNQNA
jgi:hypothetical protein